MKTATHRQAMSCILREFCPAKNLKAPLRSAGIIASLVIILAAFAGPVQADEIAETFDGTSTLTPTGTPGIFMQNFSGDGNDTMFGAFTNTLTSANRQTFWSRMGRSW